MMAAGTLEAGAEDYHVLATLTEQGFTRYRDGQAMVPWLFDGTRFWSYDDPTSLKHKTDYVRHRDLGGVMFWELTGDTDDGDLISAIHRGLARGPDGGQVRSGQTGEADPISGWLVCLAGRLRAGLAGVWMTFRA